ncbi:MAG: diacylglycerol kinase family protein [Bacteroidales bacterium]|nr:diacylglycerol kinase family protein [Bacteroidales bacterium]
MIRIKRFVKSFGYAFKGIEQLIRSEQNARVHLLATVVVIIAGITVGISNGEWAVICIAIGLVWMAEAINTALEKLVDIVSPERNPKAKAIKDMAAGAVLICAVMAVAVALFIFVPYIIGHP